MKALLCQLPSIRADMLFGEGVALPHASMSVLPAQYPVLTILPQYDAMFLCFKVFAAISARGS